MVESEVNNVVEGGICKQACLSELFSEQNLPGPSAQ